MAAITEAQADYWTATQHAKELERQKKNSVIEEEEKKTARANARAEKEARRNM